MVRQCEINQVYEKKYERIKKITTSYIVKANRGYLEPDVLINESYLHLLKVSGKIEKQEIESVILKFIKNNVLWSQGKIHKAEKYQGGTEEPDDRIDDDEIEKKIEHEKKLICIEKVYDNSTDFIKKRVHEVVTVKKIINSRSLAKHFDISEGSARQLLNQLKNDINEKFKTESNL